MPATLHAITMDAHDPGRLTAFWADVLGWRAEGHELVPEPPARFRIRFLPGREEKWGGNQAHFDLTSESAEAMAATIERALAAGGRHIDVGQTPEEGHAVLADPEGNELCVLPPGNRFLAGCGLLGGVSCDGSRDCGLFWAAALDWPLVWDQDEETAIQHPEGGAKIAWGGPPHDPKHGLNPVRFELHAPSGEYDAELARLLDLGARWEGTWLVDPDGHELSLLPAPMT
ncbi:VOC family protein [Nocardioides caeni]|uniref:VOC family protein n=1 Tax=Nocardioides caeni TaxID=574700 RepID=A0A4S8N3F2_9ACTN|nr:VOC family protein [Nocardioides caeni]THV10072.1 VOC family protein [Nocardioides caeni]